MAKVQRIIPTETATAANFSTNGKKGKPSRPIGMSDAEWWKVIANQRMPKALKALKSIARLATMENGEHTEKQAARILSDLREHLDMVERAFTNPDKPVKTVTTRYFS